MQVTPIDGTAVRLRGDRPDDVPDVLAGFADPVTRRFMPLMPEPLSHTDGDWYVRDGAAAAFAEGGSAYAIADKQTDRLLGGIGVSQVVRSRGQGEIGYWVGPWARGRGVATDAVRTLSEHALRTGTARLELLTHWANTASQRVALAAGYRREGVRRCALPDRHGGR